MSQEEGSQFSEAECIEKFDPELVAHIIEQSGSDSNIDADTLRQFINPS